LPITSATRFSACADTSPSNGDSNVHKTIAAPRMPALPFDKMLELGLAKPIKYRIRSKGTAANPIGRGPAVAPLLAPSRELLLQLRIGDALLDRHCDGWAAEHPPQ